MERENAARNPHHSTSHLLTWSEEAPSYEAASSSADASSRRHYQPSDRIGTVLSGGQITEEEAGNFNKSKTFRKPCSGHKLREMCGSKIFAVYGEDASTKSGTSDGNTSNNRTSVRIVQQTANGISQISFSTHEEISPKKSTKLPEVAKQRELSGTLERESDNRTGKQYSNAKSKELSGNRIFGHLEITPMPSADARNVEINDNTDKEEPAPPSLRTSVKVSHPAGGQSNILFGDERKTSKKIHNQKFAELTGNDIFRGDQSAEKPSSVAKMKEMSGCDIFAAAGKVDESRDHFGGGRQPPGGQSTIALV